MKPRVPSFLILLAIAGCGAAPQPAQFTDADRAEIEQTANEAVGIANGTADWKAYVDLYYAEDAWVHMDGTPTVEGRPAIVNLMSQFSGIKNFRMQQVKVDGDGNLAYVFGKATMDVPGADQKLISETFRYIEVWQRQTDGSWKIIQDIANRDVTAKP